MEENKVVVRYADGRLVKGITRDFFPNKEKFHILDPALGEGDSVEVVVKELKAIFFVRDFAGDPSYNERKEYLEGDKPQGRKVEVLFADGEKMVGATMGYDAKRPGFFLFPADPTSNNMRAYIVSAAVTAVRFL